MLFYFDYLLLLIANLLCGVSYIINLIFNYLKLVSYLLLVICFNLLYNFHFIFFICYYLFVLACVDIDISYPVTFKSYFIFYIY